MCIWRNTDTGDNACREIEMLTDRETDRQTNKQTNRKTDRQTDTYTYG